MQVRLEKIGSPGGPGYFGIGIATAGCRNVRFSDVKGTEVQDAGNLDACANVTMEDVHIQCLAGARAGWHCGKGLNGSFVAGTVTPKPCWGQEPV